MDRPTFDDKATGLKDILSSPVIKRSVSISGHATSVSLEQPFWDLLQSAAEKKGVSLNALISQIDELAQGGNLSSALRLYVLTAATHPERL